MFETVIANLAKDARWDQRQAEPRPADSQRIAEIEDRIADLRARKERADNA